MVLIQIEIPEALNKQIGIYRIEKNLASKADAVVRICESALNGN